jgi:putative sigma-54 modulation protein
MKGAIFMNIKITGKDIKATESIKDYVERKSERLVKYFGEDIDVLATMKTEGNEQVAELFITVNGETYRAVTAHKDLYASIDKDIDILEGQIRKAKTKKDKQNMTESIRLKDSLNGADQSKEIEDEIIKTIYYSIKPMAPEDAKLELEDKPKNNFLVFINIETGKVNVIYRLKDSKNYGLVEPEA